MGVQRLWQQTVCKPLLDAQHELCIVVMDSRLTSGIERLQFEMGTDKEVIAPFRAIFDRALRFSATQMVIAHNHPSGMAVPSKADLAYTKTLSQLARNLEIQLLDHWIIAGSQHFSFREEGLL